MMQACTGMFIVPPAGRSDGARVVRDPENCAEPTAGFLPEVRIAHVDIEGRSILRSALFGAITVISISYHRPEAVMNNAIPASSRTASTLRWVARILGLAVVLVFLVFFVADCVEKGTIAVESDRIVMTVMLLVTFSGLVLAWRWEGVGATLALAGLLGFVMSAPESLPRPAVVVMSALYGVPALLFLLSRSMDRRQDGSAAA